MKAAADAPFVVAAHGGTPRRRPVWVMRQAGRYLPEYREMRSRLSFLELCNDPEAAAEVTLQPMRRFDLDAAILFTDLLVPLVPMGVGLRYEPAPVLDRTIRSVREMEALKVPDPDRDLAPMLRTAELVRGELAPDRALLGFVGAPFTMACYLIEGRGGKSWETTRQVMHQDPDGFRAMLLYLARALEPLVLALAERCDGVQVFDSWAGVLASEDYAELCAPATDVLLQAAKRGGALSIDYVNGAAQHAPAMGQSAADVLAVDWRMPLDALRAQWPQDKAVQGNLDPAALFAPEERLRARVAAICEAAGPRGHVFNLGHGISKDTDPDAVAALVNEVHRW